MQQNTNTKLTRFSSNRLKRPVKMRRLMALLALLVIAAAIVGIVVAYGKLRDLWLEQCVITDFPSQVRITEGAMVKAEIVADQFGLRNGANLALIDFAKRREEILAKIPNVRDVTVTRHLPNRVDVVVEERKPFVRMNVCGKNRSSDRVADADGVVFLCLRGTQALPVIREPQSPGTPPGRRLGDRARAAIRLLETCADAEFQDVQIQEVDVSPRDYLLVTLHDYSYLRLSWKDMDVGTPEGLSDLKSRLRNFAGLLRKRYLEVPVTWDATGETADIITANPQISL